MDKVWYQNERKKLQEVGHNSKLCELEMNYSPKNIKLLKNIPNSHFLFHETLELLGYKFFGTAYVPPCDEWAFMLEEEERAQKFAEIPSDTDILITHAAPYDLLDGPQDKSIPRTLDGCHILRHEVLNRIKPLYHCIGHTHDGYGQMVENGIHFQNACIVNEEYQVENDPIWFELPMKRAENMAFMWKFFKNSREMHHSSS